MKISAIVAVANNGVIGKDNEIPWYLPADLKFFKKKTLGHAVIMGRKCYESIGRPLPKRTNIIITRNPFYVADNCIVVHSLNDAIQFAKETGETEAFIIGGAQIYAMSRPLWDELYLTTVDLETKGDTFFEPLDEQLWEEVWSEPHQPDEKNIHCYTFKRFIRKS